MASLPPHDCSTAHTPSFPCVQDEAVWEFDSWGEDLPAALRLLCAEVGGDAVVPGANCRGMFSPAARPPLPKGEWSCCCCLECACMRPGDKGPHTWAAAEAAPRLPPLRRPPDRRGAVPDGGGAAARGCHRRRRVADERGLLLGGQPRLPCLCPPHAHRRVPAAGGEQQWGLPCWLAGNSAQPLLPPHPAAPQAAPSGAASPWRWAPPWPAPAGPSSTCRPTALACTRCMACGRRWAGAEELVAGGAAWEATSHALPTAPPSPLAFLPRRRASRSTW